MSVKKVLRSESTLFATHSLQLLEYSIFFRWCSESFVTDFFLHVLNAQIADPDQTRRSVEGSNLLILLNTRGV